MSSEQRKVLVVPSLPISTIPKSKAKIFSALKAIAKEKDFDKISVREICDAAGVAKSTFYGNFQDKYAVVHWHYDMVMGAGADKIGRTLSWEEGHLITSFGSLRKSSSTTSQESQPTETACSPTEFETERRSLSKRSLTIATSSSPTSSGSK